MASNFYQIKMVSDEQKKGKKKLFEKLEQIQLLLKRRTTSFLEVPFCCWVECKQKRAFLFPGMMGLPSWIKTEEKKEPQFGREECFALKSFSDPDHDPALVRPQGAQKENSRWKFGRAEQVLQPLPMVREMRLDKLELE